MVNLLGRINLPFNFANKVGIQSEKMESTMLGKKIRYWAMCFVLGYIENGQKKFAKDSDMYKAYEKVILDVKGKYKYR